MVAIFTGLGAGFDRGSGSVLGGNGLLGSATQGRSGDGVFVNATTGNLLISRQDEYLVGRGPDVAISRTYNSLAVLDDDNNDKWRQSTDRRVFGLTGTLNTAGSTVRRVSGNGSEIVYTYRASQGGYIATDGSGAYDKLTRSGNDWIWTDGDTRITEKYDGLNGGRIIWQQDSSGNALTFTYVGSKLDKVTTEDGSWTQYIWSGNDIARIVTGYTEYDGSGGGTSRTLTSTWYEYSNGRLSKVRTDLTPDDNSQPDDSQSYWTAYQYDLLGRVTGITQKDGSSLTISYDSSGRVHQLTQLVTEEIGLTPEGPQPQSGGGAFGGGLGVPAETRVTTLTYGSGYTIVTDPAGQDTRLEYDANGNLTRIVAPPAYSGASQQAVAFTYNTSGDLTGTTDALGNSKSFTYDASGNVLTASDRLGNSVTRTYNANNQLLTEARTTTDATGTVTVTDRYVYSSANLLRYRISGDGHVVEYRYTGLGQLQYTIEYPEHLYPAGTAAPSETTVNSWRNGRSDRQSTKILKYIYDDRGNLTQEINYGYSTSTGGYSTSEGYSQTYYTYDQAGRLLARNNQGENVETFLYDGMGRMVGSTDVNGGATTIVFDDAATTTTVTLASGYIRTSTYNKAGDLISETDSDGVTGTPLFDDMVNGTTQNKYDKLGRLRVAYDPQGNARYFVYDLAGRLALTADNSGSVVEYVYDANNRVVATIAYANALTSAQRATLSDPDAVTDYRTMRPASNAADQWTWTIYDKEGRVAATIAGDGSYVTSVYDASGRILSATNHVSKLSAATLTGFKTTPPVMANLPAAQGSDPVSRIFYDRDGRVIGGLDAEGYLSQIIYDGAGQKVSETRFATITSTSLRASGSFNALLASVGTSSRDRSVHYVYDGQGLLRYQIDSLNQVTGFFYQNYFARPATTVAYAAAISATTDYSYDNIKSLVSAIASSSDDRKSWIVYDSAGRVAYTIDTGSAVTGFNYDSMGQVTRTIAYKQLRGTTSLPSLATMNSWSSSHIGDSENRITRTYYNARGELRYSVDAAGYVTRNDYNSAGQLAAVHRWDSAASVSDNTSLADLGLLTMGLGTAASRSFTYHPNGTLYESTDELGVITRYDYNHMGQLATLKRAAGSGDESITVYGYDNAGRLVSQTDAYGAAEASTVEFTYDGLGNRTTVVTRPDGVDSVTTYFYYDKVGQLVLSRDAENYLSEYEYNGFGENVRVTRRRNKTTSTASTTTRPTVSAHAKDSSSYSYFDNAGRVVMVRDAESYITQTEYSDFGEVAKVTRRSLRTSSAVSTTTQPSIVPDAGDAVTRFAYDKRGLLVSTTDALNAVETYSYDAFGNRTLVTAKNGGTTGYAYDRRGQLVSVTVQRSASVSTVTRFTYDARGNRVTMTEAYGTSSARTTSYVYDKLDRLVQTTYPQVSVTAANLQSTTMVSPKEYIAYDDRGNVIKTTASTGAETFYFYNDLDQVTVKIDALGGYTSFYYDKDGNVLSQRTYDTALTTLPATGGRASLAPGAPAGASRVTFFDYDKLGRLIESRVTGTVSGSWNGSAWVSPPDAAITTVFEYDAFSNVIRTTDPNGQQLWNWYDKLGRKTAQLDAERYRTDWEYDSDGNVTAETRYANRTGTQINFESPPSVTASSDDRVTTFGYDLTGNRLYEERQNVLFHDGLGGNSSGASRIQYAYDEMGRVTRKTEATGDYVIYDYDLSGRLVTETRAPVMVAEGTRSPTVSYSYDHLDNLLSTTASGVNLGSGYARTTSYSYDSAGRLISTTDAEQHVRSYGYDVGGRLVKESYSRLRSNNSTVTEAHWMSYDLLDRVTAEGVKRWDGTSWVSSSGAADIDGASSTYDTAQKQYNVFGEVIASGVNGLQEQFVYDAAGRLTATNSGDGVWKLFGYDRAGNQTVAFTSAGYDLAGKSLTTALANVDRTDLNATYTTYDGRDFALSAIEEGREFSATALTTTSAATITTTRSYNAFGETASVTTVNPDKRSGQPATITTTFTYNSMGRMLRSVGPAIEITLANGATNWVRPTEDYYYDKSGRMVATRDANGTYATAASASAAAAKSANTGNLTRYTLLGGTGYGNSEALVYEELHADGGVKYFRYSIHGDLVFMEDEAGVSIAYGYDKVGNRISATYESGLEEYFSYDLLGQQITHYNNFLTASDKETMDYDAQGRMVRHRTFGGDATTTRYTWESGLQTSGLGTFGGWSETTKYWYGPGGSAAATYIGKSQTEKSDVFGHAVYKYDLGLHATNFTYDVAGRQIQTSISYAGTTAVAASVVFGYWNTGQIKSNSGVSGVATYTYDVAGNRLTEALSQGGTAIKNERASFDALGRMITWQEVGTTKAPAANNSYGYDANGNVRFTRATFWELNSTGAQTTHVVNKDYWFAYDVMNRLVVDKGELSGVAGAAGTQIVRGASGEQITYDAAGRRKSVTMSKVLSARVQNPLYGLGGGLNNFGAQAMMLPPGDDPFPPEPPYIDVNYDGARGETYEYDSSGRMTSVKIVESGYTDNGDGTASATALPSASTVDPRAQYFYDLLGRVESQYEYDKSLTSIVFHRTAEYNAKGQILETTEFSRNGTKMYSTGSTYLYGENTTYLLGSTAQVSITYYEGENGDPELEPKRYSVVTNSYQWWDAAVQSGVSNATGHYSYDSRHHQYLAHSDATYTTTYTNNAFGQLTQANVADGRARTIVFTNDENGQVIRRAETQTSGSTNGNPLEIWYRFGGRQMGYTGNNGTSDVDYATSIDERQQVPPTNPGAFRGGAQYGTAYADFVQSYDPINSYQQGSAGGSYTVQAGDTLASIAATLWGDASLWYKLAEVNGMSANGSLFDGQVLLVPSGVNKSTHNAGTFKPYDPAEAIGDTSPTTPKPPKRNKCGVFGVILQTVVSVAVALALPGGGTVLGAALNGAIGNAAGQLFGIATGIQTGGFNWGAVALNGISAGVGKAIGGAGFLKTASESSDGLFGGIQSSVIRGAASGAVGNIVTQGVAVATRLQTKFDFAGVAAAGASGAVGGLFKVGSFAQSRSFGNFASNLGVATARSISGAAVRSLATGTSFGDNVIAVLPDVIGQTLGEFVGAELRGPSYEHLIQGEIGQVRQWAPDISADHARETAIAIMQAREAARSAGETGNAIENVSSDPEQQEYFLVMGAARAGAIARAEGRPFEGPSISPERTREAAIQEARIIGGERLSEFTREAFRRAYVDDAIIVVAEKSGGGSGSIRGMAKLLVDYLEPVGRTAEWVSEKIDEYPLARFALGVLDFASGPVTFITSKIVMASPVGNFVESNVGRAAQWLREQLSDAGFDPTRVGYAALGGITVGGAVLGATRALELFRIAKGRIFGRGSGEIEAHTSGRPERGGGAGFIRFADDVEQHLVFRDFSVHRRNGIGGAHNIDEFMKYSNEFDIVSSTPHPTMPGISKIEYRLFAKDAQGNLTSTLQQRSHIKTVYDPAVISDADMLTWGRQAAAQAQSAGPLNREWVGTAPNGLVFRGYLDNTGAVRTYFPDF